MAKVFQSKVELTPGPQMEEQDVQLPKIPQEASTLGVFPQEVSTLSGLVMKSRAILPGWCSLYGSEAYNLTSVDSSGCEFVV